MEIQSHIINVSKYEYVKVMQNKVKITIPEFPYYYQDDNFRTLYALIPRFYDPEKKFQHLEITEISHNRVLKTSMVCTPEYLTDIISMFNVKGRSEFDYLVQRVIEHLMEDFGCYCIRPEVFYQRLQDLVISFNPDEIQGLNFVNNK